MFGSASIKGVLLPLQLLHRDKSSLDAAHAVSDKRSNSTAEKARHKSR